MGNAKVRHGSARLGCLELPALRADVHTGCFQDLQYGRAAESQRGSYPSAAHAGRVVLYYLDAQTGGDPPSLRDS